MLLVAGSLRVALATTHLRLAEVPRAITRQELQRTLLVLDRARERRIAGHPHRRVRPQSPRG